MFISDKNRWLRLVALFAVVLLAFAACGEEEPEAGPDGNGTATEDAGGAEDFDLVKEGTLTVGSDIPYPPFEFEKGGQLTGYDVELLRAIAEKLGLENTDDDWISTDFGTIFQQLQSGTTFDVVVAAVTGHAPEGTPAAETVAERTALIDFTDPYYPALQSLSVNTDETPDVEIYEDLPDGARVGVQRATTGAFFAEETLVPLGIELVQFDKAPQLYQQLQAGALDAVFNDLPVTEESIKDKPNLAIVQQVETGEEYAIAVGKENTALKDAINQAMADLIAEGTFQEIYQKWFPDLKLPSYAQ